MIVFEASLRPLVTQCPEVSKPTEFRRIEFQPVRQGPCGFDSRDRPGFRGGNGVHGRRPGTPMDDVDLSSVSVASAGKARIEAKKAGHFAAPGTSASIESFEIAVCERPNPAPVTTENVAQPLDDGVLPLFTGEDGVRQNVDQRGSEHGIRRRIAPTSLALHEQVCVVAQCRSCAELPVFHDAPG